MNFGFTEEQEMLRDQVVRFIDDECSIDVIRTFDPDTNQALWKKIVELGWVGLTVPERFGGSGLKWVDLTVVLEETGRGLCPLPLTSNALACASILRSGSIAQQQEWLPKIANGSVVFGFGLYDEPNWIDKGAITLEASDHITGTKAFVSDALLATHIMIGVQTKNGPALSIVDGKAINSTALDVMDRTKPAAQVQFDQVPAATDRLIPLTDADLDYVNSCGAVAVTAEMVGAAEAVLALTSNYAKERIQFGHPIGKYQGVKHRLADMFVDIESFKSLLYYAAWCVDDATGELSQAASRAKAHASDAFAQIGIDGVGLHGAIGYTAEYDVQLYLKRAKWARTMFGDSDFHYDRVATLGGL